MARKSFRRHPWRPAQPSRLSHPLSSHHLRPGLLTAWSSCPVLGLSLIRRGRAGLRLFRPSARSGHPCPPLAVASMPPRRFFSAAIRGRGLSPSLQVVQAPPRSTRQHRGTVSGPSGRTRWGPSPHSRCPDPVESEATPAIPPGLLLPCVVFLSTSNLPDHVSPPHQARPAGNFVSRRPLSEAL